MIHRTVRQHFKYAKNVKYGFVVHPSWYRNSVTSGWRTWYQYTRRLGEYSGQEV